MRVGSALPLLALFVALPAAAAAFWRDSSAASAARPPRAVDSTGVEGAAVEVAPRARTVLGRNPFRVDGRMAPRSEPMPETVLADAIPRPTYELRLKGLVGGPPWLAIVAGLPGVSGDRSVRSGERFGELRILAISAVGVRVEAGDSAWTLVIEQERPR